MRCLATASIDSCLTLRTSTTVTPLHPQVPPSSLSLTPTPCHHPSVYIHYSSQAIDCRMVEEEKTLVEILEEDKPIDIVKYITFVRVPECGGIVTFSGTTRDMFDGKTIVELRYEAYVPMAIRCIKSICSAARQIWNLNSIAVAHQVGRVPVGETSVFVAISSVLRVDALDACKYVIDELKASVPI